MKLDEARKLLSITIETPPALPRPAYRRMAMGVHQSPATQIWKDERLRLLAEARDLALQAAKDEPCDCCHGTGVSKLQDGWNTLQLACEACGGSGKKHDADGLYGLSLEGNGQAYADTGNP